MILLKRFMGPRFKGSSRWADAATSNHYYKEYIGGEVICVSNLCPWSIALFRMNPRQHAAFRQGRLSLVPPGCCNPSGGSSIERCQILREQEPKNHAEVLAFVAEMEAKYNLQ